MSQRTIQMNVRMPEDKWHLINKASELRGEDISDFIRRAVFKELAKMGYLSKEERRVLGVQ